MNYIIKNVAPLEQKNALKKFSVQTSVKRYTTDVNGVIQNIIPAVAQIPFPFHLFGAWDKNGGYNIANLVTNKYDTKLLAVYTYGVNTPFFFANPFANINSVLKFGDIIFMYVDDYIAPTFYTYVIISARQGGYASYVDQSNISQIDDNGAWGVFKIFDFTMHWNDDEQLNYPFFKIKTRFDGQYKYDTHDPLENRNAYQRENVKVIRIPCEVVLNQFIGISGFIPYENNYLELIFNFYL